MPCESEKNEKVSIIDRLQEGVLGAGGIDLRGQNHPTLTGELIVIGGRPSMGKTSCLM